MVYDFSRCRYLGSADYPIINKLLNTYCELLPQGYLNKHPFSHLVVFTPQEPPPAIHSAGTNQIGSNYVEPGFRVDL